MRADRLRRLRLAIVLVVTAILGVIAFGPATVAQASTNVTINGTGSSYAYPALDQWATNLERQGYDIIYSGTSSQQGRQQYIENQMDFAGSDIAFLTDGDADPFASVDVSQIGFAYSYIPDVAGGLSFLYNLQVQGRKITNMRLSGKTLAEIFTGQITNWDNPAITKDYGKQLPSIPITVVTRSDGAGESYFLSNWMLHEYPSLWVPFCEQQGGGSVCTKDPTEFYPNHVSNFRALQGADDVAGYVASSANNGAIGYAEYYYAKVEGIPSVSMLNAAGYFVQPTASNVAIALEAAQINTDQSSPDFLMQNLDNVYSDKDPRAYPLSSYSYLVVPRTSRTVGGHTYGPVSEFNTGKGKTLSGFVNYILCGAQQQAAQLGYSPLPEVMVKGGFLQDGLIPGAVKSPAAANYSSCDNPAYLNGKDVLTAEAPSPTVCQKYGAPLDCTVVDGKAKQTNSSTGPNSSTGLNSSTNPSSSANPNSTSGNNQNSTSGNSSNSPGSKSGPGSSESINPNTGQVESSTGQAANDVAAQPVGFASQPPEQWLFGVLTAVLLLAVIAVPAGLGTWLQRTTRRGRDTSGRGGSTPPPGPGTGR
jgi:ABC-type phosphate transport system substrate-binding protein